MSEIVFTTGIVDGIKEAAANIRCENAAAATDTERRCENAAAANIRCENAAAATDTERRCENCMFGIPAMIPDPDQEWKAGMRKKRKVPGCECHLRGPGREGFPKVRASGFCGLYTDRATQEQPLRHLIYAIGTEETKGGEA